MTPKLKAEEKPKAARPDEERLPQAEMYQAAFAASPPYLRERLSAPAAGVAPADAVP